TRVLADSNVEPHPWRAFEMGTKDRSRGEHDAVALRRFRQRERVIDMREARPYEHAVRGLHEQFHADMFEVTHNIQACLAKSLMQTRQILTIVTIYQHQIDEPLGELRTGDAGQRFDVGEFVGDVVSAGDESHTQAA